MVELGMLGGVLPAVGLDRPLGHPDFDPVYAVAEQLDVPLAVHGGPTAGLGLDVLDRFAQVHTLAHPFAQMRALTSVLMSRQVHGGRARRVPGAGVPARARHRRPARQDGVAASRLRAALRLLQRAPAYRFLLGRDLERNERTLLDFLGGL